ncbi:MAG: nuclear transport factor 2 family protein [Proteobacteria bacterium]|nr:nuclear transport factor 2 family protein [Pseudomonadota bacterium]
MTENAMRAFCRAFRDALTTRELATLAALIDDDVDWMVFGPIDLLPIFGHRRGKAAVLDMCAATATCLQMRACDQDSVLVDGECAAAIVRFGAVHKPTGRVLSLRVALFARFRDGRLVSLKAVFDSFDAAEQMLGHAISLAAMA